MLQINKKIPIQWIQLFTLGFSVLVFGVFSFAAGFASIQAISPVEFSLCILVLLLSAAILIQLRKQIGLLEKKNECVYQRSNLQTDYAYLMKNLKLVSDLSTRITTTLDTRIVFNQIQEFLSLQFNVSRVILYRFNFSTTKLEQIYGCPNYVPRIFESDINRAAIHAARNNVEVFIDELDCHEETEFCLEQGCKESMLNSLSIPLIVSGRILGVMFLQRDANFMFSECERLIFRFLCSYAGIALNNDAIYSKMENILLALKDTQIELIQKNDHLQKVQVELLSLNQELAHANALQAEHQGELTRFLAVASHDLRQPMHALILYLGALQNCEATPEASRIVGNSLQCAHIMDNMFLELLDLSRLDSQVVVPVIENFSMNNLLRRIEVEFAQQALEKGLELRIAPCNAWVSSDSSLIEQILRNFTANAIRYSSKGTVLIGCRRIAGKLRLAVYDTGIGISDAHQKNVFEEFNQIGQTSRDPSKGLGLGLAIVKRIARLLDIEITLVSSLGHGSMFAVDLDLVASPASTWQEKRWNSGQNRHSEHTGLAQLQGKTIVVVDDEENILSAMRVLLEQWGCKVLTALTGAAAMEQLSASMCVPDIIICDYLLRFDEIGLDVVTSIQQEFNEEIPSIIVTGTITPDRSTEMNALGIRLLHKPVNADGLLNTMLKMINLDQQSMDLHEDDCVGEVQLVD